VAAFAENAGDGSRPAFFGECGYEQVTPKYAR
jgi:hypothetical protein